MNTAPFLVMALPRSRTFWLSRLLNHGGWVCQHEESLHARGVEDVKSWLALEGVGSVETAAAPFWRLARKLRPDTRIALIRRPVPRVVDSLMALGIAFDREKLTANMTRVDRKLDQIERRVPGVLSVTFDALQEEATCGRVFEHCLGMPMPHAWWERFNAVNLQVNLPAMLRYMASHAPQLRRAEALCALAIRNDMRSTKVKLGPCDSNGVSIQHEGPDTFYRDGKALFAEHCLAVGESADEWTRKNVPLIHQLGAHGHCQFTTARSNGRMLAYLVTVISPSLEAENRLTAVQTLFYASRDAAGLGLGMALQKASLADLRKRGVHEVLHRAGVRGEGPRLGILYQRLGAEPCGQLYRTPLKVA